MADSSRIIRYTSPMLNTTIAHYKITAEIGKGGMGDYLKKLVDC